MTLIDHTYRCIEDSGENEQKDDVEEVDRCDGDIKCVGLSIHPWSKNADSNKEGRFDDEQSNGLSRSAVLAKSDKQRLD